ncbi:MAG: ATP-binding cassette, subfamily multidrug efflux pump [Clostridiales bacterium]|nr:ATP-binding cassette, subfamily multidrug efflux pump [Clostridiales bacterium]
MMKQTEEKLPEGFNAPADEKIKYHKAEHDKAANLNFMRRGGPPGPNMGLPVEKPKQTKQTVSRLIKYFKNEKKLLVFLISAVLISTIVSLFAPALQGSAIDIILQGKWADLYGAVAALFAVYVLSTACSLVQSLLSAHLSQRIVSSMRYDLFAKINRLSIKYLDTHSNGDVMSRMTNDVENVSNAVSQSIGSLVSGALTVIGTIAIMFYYCWQLTLITLLTVVITVVVTKELSQAMRRIYKKRSELLGMLNGHSEEMITGYKSVVAYNKQQDVIEEFNKASDELTKVSIRAEILGGSMGPIMNCISNISFVIVAAFGGYFALKGMITVGIISAFIIYARQFSRPINEIAQLYGSLQTAVAGAERVFELIDQPDEDNSGNLPIKNIKGRISFKNVNFSYTPDKQVLFDFNLDVDPGQKIALVGATGSGKTTVVNLLTRFYPVDSGEILIDGVNIMDLNRDELRRNIAIVLQDTVLFSDTIEKNIKYANHEASDEEMTYAAQMSNCAYFIERLPEQYQTFLKHAGSSLSQGQRQLLAIARAILADPKILILDEATSSVDTRTEKHIQDAMVNLMKNRTSLIIAHRLSTIQDADKIVVMDKGRIVESGTHDELLKQKGRYYELYMTQFAGNAI